MNENLKVLVNGILKENAVLVLAIGLCPALAVSNTAFNGLGMGIAATFVLVFSNILISSMRKITPDNIRIPIFIVVISTFVTIVDYLIHAYVPELYIQLGVFIPLIVVNCIILGRAEAYAYKNGIMKSAMDGIGMGLGFTLLLLVMGIIRELLGMGTIELFGLDLRDVMPDIKPVLFMSLPPGAFLTIGMIMALQKRFSKK